MFIFLTELTNVTDRRTDRRTPHDGIGRACIALRRNKMVQLGLRYRTHIIYLTRKMSVTDQCYQISSCKSDVNVWIYFVHYQISCLVLRYQGL